MKKWMAFILAGIMMFSAVGCGGSEGSSEETAKEPETVGEFLAAEFKANPEGTAQEITDRILAHEIIPFDGASMPVEPGLLTGFDNAEITGFQEGVMFAPMMGTIPFVGYVFVLENGADVDAFVKTLEESANLRWNICTEAEELTVAHEGSTVFFLMSPKEFTE